MCKMLLKVILNKNELNNKRQIIHIPQTLMDSLPSSKYHKDWDVYIPTDEGFHNDTTVVYWPLMDESSSEHAKLDPPIPSTSHTARRRPTFDINWHVIRQRKPRYWFKCKVGICDSTFSTIHGWNFHHSYTHKNVILQCETWKWKFTSPSAHHAHKSAHAPRKHICTICSKSFPFKSGLRQHMTVHIKQKHHRCFAGNCKWSYKWASDLNHHDKTHIDWKHQCPDCDYSSREERLYKCHLKEHLNEFKYRCTYCDFKTKWPTPFKWHTISCKVKRLNTGHWLKDTSHQTQPWTMTNLLSGTPPWDRTLMHTGYDNICRHSSIANYDCLQWDGITYFILPEFAMCIFFLQIHRTLCSTGIITHRHSILKQLSRIMTAII